MRLQKYLAKCGIGSRRTCESYIDQGRVSVDGKTVTTQGLIIDPSTQVIRFDNIIVTPKPIEWIMLYKPPEYLSTAKDPSGKPVFLELLPSNKHHLFAVGRLDFLSEGLLLVTNEGDIANKLIHPRYEIEKEYLVTTIDKISNEQFRVMKQGFLIDNECLSVKSIRLYRNNEEKRIWEYAIVITEGKNRHIRRMLDHLSIRIKRLKRIRLGPLTLCNLNSGEWRFLSKDEISQLHRFVNK